MATATVKILDKTFEFKYDDPTEAAIKSQAQSIHEKSPWKSMETCQAEARLELEQDALKAANEKVSRAATKIIKQMEDAQADVGFSQRIREKPTFDLGGILVKEIDADQPDPRIISDEEVNEAGSKLVDELNKALLAKHKERVDPSETRLLIPTPDKTDPFLEQIHKLAVTVTGGGTADALWAQEASRFNRFERSLVPKNRELTGFTFITRPCCNLSRANLAGNRKFAPLVVGPDNSMQTMIRWYLDTKLCYEQRGERICQLIDTHNPFNVLLCNNLLSINGFLDYNLSLETSEGGFFSEQQTCVVGGDRLAHGNDLQLQFKDMPGGPVMALHEYWTEYCANIMDGSMSQYPEDIEHNLMAYTVSIYRFMVDPTTRIITRWAKATGCYPKMSPSGTPFNKNQGEHVSTAASEFVVPYQAHKLEYNDPIILTEFNILVDRYRGYKVEEDSLGINLAATIENNYAGLPYVSQRNGINELVWQYSTDHDERELVQTEY